MQRTNFTAQCSHCVTNDFNSHFTLPLHMRPCFPISVKFNAQEIVTLDQFNPQAKWMVKIHWARKQWKECITLSQTTLLCSLLYNLYCTITLLILLYNELILSLKIFKKTTSIYSLYGLEITNHICIQNYCRFRSWPNRLATRDFKWFMVVKEAFFSRKRTAQWNH